MVLLGAPLFVKDPNCRRKHGRGGERKGLGAPSLSEQETCGDFFLLETGHRREGSETVV